MCRVCQHPDVADIDRVIRERSVAEAAEEWAGVRGLSETSLARHKRECWEPKPSSPTPPHEPVPRQPPTPPSVRRPEHVERFAAVVREMAATIVSVAEGADDGAVILIASADDPFVEAVDAVELPVDAQRLIVDLESSATTAAVRLAMAWRPPSGGEWTLVANYASTDDVPEAPAAARWSWSAPSPFPCLRHAPLDPEALARWALDSGDDQAMACAALVVEATSGLEHQAMSPVVALWSRLDARGLSYYSSEVLNAEHREAVCAALALREGLREWTAGQGGAARPVEVEAVDHVEPVEPVTPKPERVERIAGPAIDTALRSAAADGWRYPLGMDRGRRAPWGRAAAVAA